MKIDRIAKQVFFDVVNDFARPCLQSAGFTPFGKEGRFKRWTGDCFSSVSCGLLMEQGHDVGRMQVSAGVGFKSLADFLIRFPEAHVNPKEPSMMGGCSGIMHGGPPYKTVEWRVGPGADVPTVGRQVEKEIREFAVPYC